MNEQFSAAQPQGSAAGPRELPIEFSASGSEYFRIWIVNLLLIIVTLGLYLPFAKARRLSYFYSNTLVDGQALAFHGNPWKMFRGFVLLAVLMLVYGISGQISPTAGVAAFLILAAVWPALWRAGLQFRLANTSWRGLRFAFTGDLRQAYLAMLPAYLPAALIVVVSLLNGEALESKSFTPAQGVIGAATLLIILLTPWTLSLSKRYQQSHYALAGQHSRFGVGTGAFYLLMLKFMLFMIGYALLAGAVLASAYFLLRAPLLVAPLALLAYLGLFALVGPFFTVALQNMVWRGTSSAGLRFDSQLRLRAFAWLNLKNWLLTALTLGLYRPFAVVHANRMRLEAVSLRVNGDIDGWVARKSAQHQDASGDAAGDFFGIDMGF